MSRKVGKSFLEEISIKSLGVIESTNIEFKPGLTVLTGETGAGKTMILTALNNGANCIGVGFRRQK